MHLLQVWDEDADGWVTPKGTFQVHVGGSSETSTEASFRFR